MTALRAGTPLTVSRVTQGAIDVLDAAVARIVERHLRIRVDGAGRIFDVDRHEGGAVDFDLADVHADGAGRRRNILGVVMGRTRKLSAEAAGGRAVFGPALLGVARRNRADESRAEKREDRDRPKHAAPPTSPRIV